MTSSTRSTSASPRSGDQKLPSFRKGDGARGLSASIVWTTCSEQSPSSLTTLRRRRFEISSFARRYRSPTTKSKTQSSVSWAGWSPASVASSVYRSVSRGSQTFFTLKVLLLAMLVSSFGTTLSYLYRTQINERTQHGLQTTQEDADSRPQELREAADSILWPPPLVCPERQAHGRRPQEQYAPDSDRARTGQPATRGWSASSYPEKGCFLAGGRGSTRGKGPRVLAPSVITQTTED